MAYQALYRKWRPRTFDEVVGQDAAIETLKNQLRFARIGHAYLFCGARGTGKTSAAKIMARAVNCPNAMEHDGNPCNECAMCRAIETGSAMNVIEIDAASNNGVDNIRDIREEVEYPPVQGRYKVYIIDEVHMLSTGAFNALLKTLEEPPEYVIFILATTDPQKLPATILSRCQRFDFRLIGRKTIEKSLSRIVNAEGMKADTEAISHIAWSADGSMRDALSLLDQCLSYHPEGLTLKDCLLVMGAADRKEYRKLFREMVRYDTEGALGTLSGLIDSGADIMRIVSDMTMYLRDVLIAGSLGDEKGERSDISVESMEEKKEDALLVTKDRLMKMLREFAALPGELRYSGAKRAILEIAVIGLAAKPAGGEPAEAEKTRTSTPSRLSPKSGESDIDFLRSCWPSLAEQLHPSNRPLFAGAVLKEERGEIVIVFKNKMNFRLAAENQKENGVLKLRELSAGLLGHKVSLVARPPKAGETEASGDRIGPEDLSKIHFPVETEN